jgi:hypothetical protein
MTAIQKRCLKGIIYGVGVVSTLATSPLYEYFGTTGFTQRTLSLDTEMVHYPFSATVTVSDPSVVEQFNTCAWDLVFELEVPLPLDTEVVVWGLTEPWNQEAFDQAYAVALEQSDTAVENDTGILEEVDTGTEESTGSDTGLDTARQNDTGETDSEIQFYENFNPAHQVFYDTMRRIAGEKYAYRILEMGGISGPLFEEYASIVVQDSRRLLFYSECGDVTDHFVLTIQGESIDIESTLSIVAHQGEQVAQPIACGGKVDNPDYSTVELSVVTE